MQETQDNKLTEMAIHKELDLIQGCISEWDIILSW